MIKPIILFTDEALEYFVEAKMFILFKELKESINRHRGSSDLHFYLTKDFTSAHLATWKAADDVTLTLDQYCAWSILPTPESRQAYLACMSPSDS